MINKIISVSWLVLFIIDFLLFVFGLLAIVTNCYWQFMYVWFGCPNSGSL